MALFATNIITSDSALGSAKIQKSLRFNDGDTAYLQKGVSSAGNRKTFTYSVWCKRTESSSTYSGNSANCLFYQGDTAGNELFYLTFNGEDKLELQQYDYPTNQGRKITTQKFRDPSAWYHIVLRIDTTNSTANDRFRIYLNGEQITDFVTNDGTTSQNLDTWVNDTTFDQYIGKAGYNNLYMDGYLAEINFVDGSSLDPSSFGFTDPVTGIWMPKRYEGTYGTNGFYLDFSDNSSTTALGIDKSPNGNDWTPNNFSVSAGSGNDSMLDTPTNNFPTLSSVDMSGNALEDANLQGGTAGTSGWRHTRSTVPLPSTGKWYWECKVPDASANASNGWMTGLAYSNLGYTQDINSNSTGLYGRQTDSKYNNSSSDPVTNSHFSTVSNNDILQYAYDADSQKLFTGRNNTWELSANPSTGANPNWTSVASGGFPMVGSYGSSRYVIINFGQQGFSYTPPTGYRSLSTNNLPPNVPSVVRPEKHFKCIAYDGDGSSDRNITGLEFKPDLIWIKNRTQASTYSLQDSTIGFGDDKTLRPDTSNAQDTNGNLYGYVNNTFNGGFNLNAGSDHASSRVNSSSSGAKHIAWCWKAGGDSNTFNVDGAGYASASAAGITDGSISLTNASVNREAGFSIVRYTGTGSSGTVGHGLGATPNIVITKSRSATGSWAVLDTVGNSTAEYGLFLNDNGGYSSYQGGTYWSDTLPTSTVFTVNSNAATNASSVLYVAYCWTSIPGFSKFGKYTGNGSDNGTFVYTGFRPAWVTVKNTNTSNNWQTWDNAREPNNVMQRILEFNDASTSDDPSQYTAIDFLANGFKHRTSFQRSNTDGGTYIYLAFAEQPGTTPFDTFPNAR